MQQSDVFTYRLDHLGIIAGICRHIRLIERIDAQLPAPSRNISHGEAVQAMILNALGFVSRPLYLTPEFWKNKPFDLLLRPGLTPEDLSEDAFGQTLDALSEAGVTELFASVAAPALETFGLLPDIVHFNSSSFSFFWDSPPALAPSPGAGSPQPVHITYGDPKDHRPALQQAMLNLHYLRQTEIPLGIEALGGDTSDALSSPQTIDAFCEQLRGERPIFVTDSSFYSAENLGQTRISWLSLVPETVEEAQTWMDTDFEEGDWQEADDEHSYREVRQSYAGVEQRWLIVYSLSRAHRQKAKLQSKIKKARLEAGRERDALTRRRFACLADAERAAETLSEKWPYHNLRARFSMNDVYEKRERPTKGGKPTSREWRVAGAIEEKPEVIREAKRHQGLYILATNVLDAQRLPAASMLALYKSQTASAERRFRFLKDPLFFASEVYLQRPERIIALQMVMSLSLLIYALAEESLRRELKRQQATLPTSKDNPTERPTLRRIFQLFKGIDLLEIRSGESAQRRMNKIRETHREILEYLPLEAKRIYFPDEGCGR